MYRKIMAMFLALVMVFLLVACGNANVSNTNASGKLSKSSSTQNGKVINVWVAWTPGEATEKALVEKFKEYEKETGVKINYTNFSLDMIHDKVLSAAAAGNPPDLIWGIPEWIGEFYKMGILEDLTDRFNSWSDKNSIPDSIKKAMTVDNKIVGIPYESTVRGYLVHANMLEKANVKVPKTWDDLLALKDYKKTQGKYPFEITGTSVREPQELLVYLAEYDLEIATLQSDGKYRNTWNDNKDELAKAAKVFQFYKDLFNNGIVDPNARSWGWQNTDENFVTGIVATDVSGNWLSERESTNPDTMKDIEIYPIPYPSDGHTATYLEAKPMFIFKASKNKEGAFDLATKICSKEWQQAAFADRSPRADVYTESKWVKDFHALADKGVTFPNVTLGGITQAMQDAIAKLLQEGKSPEEVAKWLSDAVNSSLNSSGELSKMK
ncbi:ABC transporter substrate-binding protein [Thermoanaerobacterium thermosaccharolyticum]|uniref:ABC transporter substrate-binding protein n=1 Tax=Thermoanaerobacterium thermosaccharolyticum TaxID=1517 RepID=UPI003DA86D52